MKEKLSNKELPFAYSLQQIAKEFIVTKEDSPETIRRKKSFSFGITCGPYSQEDFENFAKRIQHKNVGDGRDVPEMILQANLEGGECLSKLHEAGLGDDRMRVAVYEFIRGWVGAAKRNRAEMIIYSKKYNESSGIFILSDEAINAWESLEKKIIQQSQPSSINKK